MKKAAVFSFSERGAALALDISKALKKDYDVSLMAPRGDLKSSAAEMFSQTDAMIFVGACGIAVRAIAPLVASKVKDPAVVVVDERGNYAVSLLSGHIGGANDLTRTVAKAIGAQPVITTATEVNGRFSVDSWAAKQGLHISSMELAKLFSAQILKKDLPLYSEVEISGTLPEGVFIADNGDVGAAVTYRDIKPFKHTLLLIPPVVHLGIGCRRGTSAEAIRAAVDRVLADNGIRREAVTSVSSVDVKSDEKGLLDYCSSEGLDVFFYSAERLSRITGDFSSSEFVAKTVGVDNVCERAAVCTAGDGAHLAVKKTGADGVTVAAAIENRRFSFE